MTNDIIFKTVVGSHLYGLNHPGSDLDEFVVYFSKRKIKVTQAGGIDLTEVCLSDLLDNAFKGGPNFVEAVFSFKKEWFDPSWRPMFDTLRIPAVAIRDPYLHRINDFLKIDTQKSRQHAVRLGLTIQDLKRNDGWFNPTLTEAQKSFVISQATGLRGEELLESIKELMQ